VRWKASDGSLLLIYRARRDERLSWPGWLTYSGRFARISGYISATGRAQDREVRRPKDRRSTTVLRNRELRKTVEPIEMPFGMWTGLGPRKHLSLLDVGAHWRRLANTIEPSMCGVMRLFVAHKMTRNNTANTVHVAATELPQLLSQNTNRPMFGEATAQSRCQTLCSSKVTKAS